MTVFNNEISEDWKTYKYTGLCTERAERHVIGRKVVRKSYGNPMQRLAAVGAPAANGHSVQADIFDMIFSGKN